MTTLAAQLFKQAIDTAQETCPPDKCTVSEGLDKDNSKLVHDECMKYAVYAKLTDGDPVMAIFDVGLHIGYRLHQLETQPIDKEKVN